MADRFSKNTVMLESPITDGFNITPSNVTVFSQPTRAIYVGVGGNLEIVTQGKVNNTTLLFVGVPSGALIPIRAQQVTANTTCGYILGLY